jgi:hypothetical protein
MSITGPHLGILDLTQSEPPSSKKKTSARRRNLEDNSFAPPPKKLRRPLQAKDPNEQRGYATTTAVQVKISSSALEAQDGARTGHAAQRPGEQHADNTDIQCNAAPEGHPQADISPHGGLGTMTSVIERSDDAREQSDTKPECHGILAGEGQDSCGTHVSETPPRRDRTRACSMTSRLSSHHQGASGVAPKASLNRAFRRVNTH